MPTPKKTGPLTQAELLDLWRSVTDSGYHRPLIELGEGRGLEVYTQGFEQLARASEAIDRTTQAMYILPHSGQTNEPASGGRKATVDVTLTRTKLIDRELTFVPGRVVFAEETTDYGKNGPEVILTGRRYVVLTQATFAPGDPGPLIVKCEAERIGYGANNAHEGSILRFMQPGAGFQNDSASVELGTEGHRLIVRPDPDVVVPEHVGRYVLFTGGSNVGQVRRVIGYEEPVATGSDPNGGTAILAPTGIFAIAGLVGTYRVGEQVVQTPNGATGVVVFANAERLIVDRLSGTFVAGDVMTGVVSGAVSTLSVIEQSPDLVPEVKTAMWLVLDWEVDLGITATNDAKPSGGRAAMLDELGHERRIGRAPGEEDSSYRKRVATPADVVSPNAIRRIANRVLAPLGAAAVLREVGSALLPGLYYDGDPSTADPTYAYAFDMDFVARPADRFKLRLDYVEFRAFFLVGVPGLNLGEFGIAYDAGITNAYDAAPFLAFYDGYPLTAAMFYRRLWQAIYDAKAGGVGFDLVVE